MSALQIPISKRIKLMMLTAFSDYKQVPKIKLLPEVTISAS